MRLWITDKHLGLSLMVEQTKQKHYSLPFLRCARCNVHGCTMCKAQVRNVCCAKMDTVQCTKCMACSVWCASCTVCNVPFSTQSQYSVLIRAGLG